MSFTPFDWEEEERRDSERFAEVWMHDDGPDPSEYEDRMEPDYEDDVVTDLPRNDLDQIAWQKIKDEYVAVFITQRHENDALKGLLLWLVIILGSFMAWIWFGAALDRFLRWLF